MKSKVEIKKINFKMIVNDCKSKLKKEELKKEL